MQDLAPDGTRVVVVTEGLSGTSPAQEHQVVFLFNCFDELRRKVPLGKQAQDSSRLRTSCTRATISAEPSSGWASSNASTSATS